MRPALSNPAQFVVLAAQCEFPDRNAELGTLERLASWPEA